MTERLLHAKNGLPVVVRGSAALHSRYDPVSEAARYVAALDAAPNSEAFLLVEPALGYLAEPLKQRFPRARIYGLHSSAFFSRSEAGKVSRIAPDANWTPAREISLEDFLEDALEGIAVEKVRIVEWRPGIDAYGKQSLALFAQTAEIIRRIHANRVTEKAFARRWVRNFLRNLDLLDAAVTHVRGNAPVVVCASGPGLEEAIPLISLSRPSIFLAAVSSAAPALLARDLIPDLIVASDGGPWALLHLYEACRREGSGAVYAAALSAALPSQLSARALLPFRDGSLYQELVLGKTPFLRFPQRGTVSASALDLAMVLTSGPVYVAGLDLAHRDLRTHARPYAFDTLADTAATRCRPAYSQAFEREAHIRSSSVNGIYASWFKSHSYGPRLFSLGASAELGIPRGSPKPARGLSKPVFTAVKSRAPDSDAGKRILLDALKNPLLKKRLDAELGDWPRG
ncbi:MAG: DUF115 domain-containing protein [Treponema sp.]|nr:DUF115 domain-containing protein [Treponema sp.]